MIDKRNQWLYVIEVILLFIITSVIAVFYLNQSGMGLFFNSDILGIPNIFKDLAGGGSLKDWAIPSTAMFIPDWLVFFIGFSLSKNIYYQLLIMACLNTLLLYLMVRLIYSLFFPQKYAFIFSLASLSIFLFFTLNNLEPFIFLLVPAQHVGALTIGLFYFFVQIKLIDQFKNPNKLYFWLLLALIICLIMGLSDLFFIVQFSLPVLLAYLIMLIKREIGVRKVFIFSFIPLCFSMLGAWLIPFVLQQGKVWTYLNQHSLSQVPFDTIKYNIHFIINNLKLFQPYILINLVYLLFYTFILFIFFSAVFGFKFKKILLNKKNIFFTLFITLSCFSTILAFLSVKIDPTIRYLEPLFFFPILTFFYIGSFFNYSKLLKALFVFAFFILLYFVLSKAKLFYNNLFSIKGSYYPYELSCIEKALQDHDHHGIANYWIARPFSMFSQQGLVINEFFGNLTPFKWNTNVTKVSNSNSYTFVILDNVSNEKKSNELEFNQAYIENINGPSEQIIFCGNKKLLIYPKNRLRVAVFVKKGDLFTWPAFILPSVFPNSVDLKQRTAKVGDGPGYVTFGPYTTLTSGKYRVSISYWSDASSSKKIGLWDILSHPTDNDITMDLFGTDNEVRTIESMFIVPANPSENNYEIRTFTSGVAKLTVKNIKLVKL
ncbi:MAG: hypothetical protein E6K54_03560 [Gammaproteobacteria bacterium]|nr:MAG: hypothetical protein E6K54_03560 [Gammaproteobacteria bacterium]